MKLVGPTISCEGIEPEGMPLRKNPHVQSFLVVTDQVRGLRRRLTRLTTHNPLHAFLLWCSACACRKVRISRSTLKLCFEC